jgi:pimeloyl-ACP methyl ester carboxylesterase
MSFLKRPDGEIFFIDEGQGPPIILIHGFASNHAVNWVNPLWVKVLVDAGRRVIAIDNRGHGRSTKFYRPEDYTMAAFVADTLALFDHLSINRADVMGYSMGARITSFLARAAPERMARIILGGLGDRIVTSAGLPLGIAEALEAANAEHIAHPGYRMFRKFAEATQSDRAALAACVRGARESQTIDALGAIEVPVLVCVGEKDEIAGDGAALATLFQKGEFLAIPGRDHNLAVGDKVYKNGVLAFLER